MGITFMWQLSYDAPKGLRTNRGFWAVMVEGIGMWYSNQYQKWLQYDHNHGIKGSSTHDYKPKTKKAFLRYLSKHPELKGHTVVLVHREYIVDRNGKRMYDLHIRAKWEDCSEVKGDKGSTYKWGKL